MLTCFATTDGLLADPLTQLLMRADQVDATRLRRDLTDAAARLARRAPKLDLCGARVRFAPETRPNLIGPRVPAVQAGGETGLCC